MHVEEDTDTDVSGLTFSYLSVLDKFLGPFLLGSHRKSLKRTVLDPTLESIKMINDPPKLQ